ncbi:MAG: hypothetical protein QOI51_1712 [Nocardioidaceae bacterium]|jgi:hypothetical protein|nr:hypothetical protein [Nocardioidaceae bacterium]MDX6310080.1 hypothetical protein [Nocardioidaceae bacterium]
MARKDKGSAAKGATDKSTKKQGGIRRLIAAYKMTRERDKRVGIICLAWFLGVAIVLGGLVSLWNPYAGVVVGIPAGALAWVVVFGRRAERAAYAEVEGRPGAAGAALGILRKGWQVQQAVAVTKNQDLVHRVVGRPGVILVGEGNVARVRNLLSVEKKKHARVVGDVPIYDIAVGDGDDGTIEVRALAKHIQKLPRNIAPADITDVMQRLRALDAMRPQVPIPKGPMPTSSKQARASMRGSMRGR